MPAVDVVFIDDEVSLTEIFQHYVLAKYREWRFMAFSNSAVAYQEIIQHQLKATVWIVDLMMPGKNGAEIAQAIRKKHGQDPIVLAYTALDRQDIQKHEEYREGMVYFDKIINKMEDPLSLLALVDVWVLQEQIRSS